MLQQKRIGIGLLGKGSTNHLHRSEIVQALQENGFKITFIVREDYTSLLSRFDGCSYVTCRFCEEKGWRNAVSRFCETIRLAYPSNDIGRRGKLVLILKNNLRPWVLARNLICFAAARFRIFVLLSMWIEGVLFRPELVQDIVPSDYDLLLVLGIGAGHAKMEGLLTQWADSHNIPQIHIVGNYDNLTSKGFRGILPEKLLVWGPQMRRDAIDFQGIDESKVRIIGSLRYNSIIKTVFPERTAFLKRIGLDPAKKMILFAGFVYDSQYFEMLQIYRQLIDEHLDCQLIVRLYPNKILMSSVYIQPIMQCAKILPHVYVSCADPHFKEGIKDREVLQIEEDELWPALQYCDVLIDYYSTIAIEGAIFDKPCIHMHYIPNSSARGFEKKPVPIKFWRSRHNRRIMSYGAVDVAYNREEMISFIRLRLDDPDKHAEARKKMVAQECGPLDGLACDRLIHECKKTLSSGEVLESISAEAAN